MTAADAFNWVRWQPRAIQAYLFLTPKLKDIRGAANALEKLVDSGLDQLLIDHQAEPVYLAGGGGLVQVAADRTDALIKALRRAYHGTVPDLPLRIVAVPGSEHPFEATDAALATADIPRPAFPALGPAAVPCVACRREAATRRVADDLICEVCAAKRRGRLDSAFLQTLRKKAGSWSDTAPPEDLITVGDACLTRPGYVALIVADGNRFGTLFRSRQRQPSLDLQGYRAFSVQVRVRLIEALVAATCAIRKEPPAVLPLDVLYLGGDDALMVTAADLALDFCLAASAALEKSRHAARDKVPTSLSYGVVFARHNTPIAVMQRLGDDLLASAKRRSDKTQQACLDFAVLHDAAARDLDDLREADRFDGYHTTAKPYTLVELKAVLDTVKRLRGLSLGRLNDLVDACTEASRARLALYALLGRMEPGEARSLEQALCSDQAAFSADSSGLPWVRREGDTDRVTLLKDLLELMPFYGRAQEEEDDD